MAYICNKDIIFDFGCICRLCLSADNELFELTDVRMIEKLSVTTGIKVCDNDVFPRWVCSSCLFKLQEASNFIEICLHSQSILKESFKKELQKAGIISHEINFEDSSPKKPSVLKTGKEKIKAKNDREIIDENVTLKYMSAKSLTTCVDCCKTFANKNELLEHRIGVHHDDLFDWQGPGVRVCEKCRAKLNSNTAYNIHMQSHERKSWINDLSGKTQPVSCKYCGKTYLSNDWYGHCEQVHRVIKKEQSVKKAIDCKICLRPFVRLSALCNHILKHHSDRIDELAEKEGCYVLWICRECDAEYCDGEFLLQHYSDCHSRLPKDLNEHKTLQPQSETCECGYIMTSPLEDRLHEIFMHSGGNSNLNCPACEQTFSVLPDLQMHMISFHSFLSAGLDNVCVLCDEPYSEFEELRSHLLGEHNLRLNQETKACEGKVRKCVKSDCFVQLPKMELLSHLSTIHGMTKVFHCKICDCCYETRDLLMHHMCSSRINEEEKLKFICPTCKKSFPSKMNLHNHFKRKHLGISNHFVCSYCGESFKGRVALQSHEDRLHRGVRRYPCPDCPQAFTTSSILRKHSEQHMAHRPMHTCAVCGRMFSTVSGFSRHIATHEGTKNFVCTVEPCRKAFYTKSELRRHIKFHTHDFKHVCELCGHKFVSPGELRKHQTRHTGERPFLCHLCPAAYSRRDDKVKHMKRIHHLRAKKVYGQSTKEIYVKDDLQPKSLP